MNPGPRKCRGIAAVVLLAALAACHHSNRPAVMVAVNPKAPSVPEGTQQAFSATVTGNANTAVTWSVDQGMAGGTISANGIYTAPMTTGTFQVRATSVADPAQSAAANVTVTGPLPATTLATGVSGLLGADGPDVLYAKSTPPSTNYCLYVSRTGVESYVDCAGFPQLQTQIVSGGYIVQLNESQDGDEYSIIAITSDNTSALLRIGVGNASLNRVRWPWVLYFYTTGFPAGFPAAGLTEYVLFNAITGQTYTIALSNPSYLGPGFADFIVSGSVISVYFATPTDIEQWDTQSQVSTSLVSPASVASLAADGGLLAWAEPNPMGRAGPYGVLHALNLSDGTATTVSSTITQYFLGGGLLVWREGALDTLKQFDGNAVTTIASSAAYPLGTDSGYVLYWTAIPNGTTPIVQANMWAHSAAGTQLVANDLDLGIATDVDNIVPSAALITGQLVYYIGTGQQLEVATLP